MDTYRYIALITVTTLTAGGFNYFDYFDYDIIVFIINDYIFFEIIEYIWVYIYIKACNIIISIFNIKFVYKVFFLKFQNSFFEIIQSFVKIILFITRSNILYVSLWLLYPTKISRYIFISNFFRSCFEIYA